MDIALAVIKISVSLGLYSSEIPAYPLFRGGFAFSAIGHSLKAGKYAQVEWRSRNASQGKIRGRGRRDVRNGGGPKSHIPAHAATTTVAPFRAWRGSQFSVAGGPKGPP